MEQAQARDFHTVLREIYPGVPDEVFDNIIQIVEEGNPMDTFEGKLENMSLMLSEYGAWAMAPAAVNDEVINRYYAQLMEIFPDANPDYMLQFCQEGQPNFDLVEAIQKLSTEGYDRIEVDPLLVWEQLKNALPDADPYYLKKESFRLASMTQQDMDDFLQNAIEKNDYPTMKEYLEQKKERNELAIYKHFDVERYLEVIPNPEQLFTDPNRPTTLNENAAENDIQYALTFLYNNYSFIRKKYINLLFNWKNKNLVEICARLDKMGKNMRKPRQQEAYVETKNVALLQEVAFLKHRKLIKRVLRDRCEVYRMLKEEARAYNLLQECQCCFEEEMIPEECYFCLKGCVFCKECVRRGTENAIGNGDLRFPCFNNCDSEFTLQTLQMVVPRNIFEKLILKIASEEVRKANVEGLETCPFCDFAMVLPENEKIFKCINQDCLIESCRECRHRSHVPLRCSEIEYDEDIRRRTYIENKMTEALTRTCHKCKRVFIKENGCNKMTCQCGAKQCYLCGAAIENYNHFGSNRCALFTNDNEINLQRVLNSAQNAKQDLGNVQIKFDPSANIETFFKA